MEETNTTIEATDETSTTSTATSVVTTTEPQVTDETSETTTAEKQPSLDELQAQIKRMEKALKTANTEAKTYRLEANELKKFKEQTEAEKLTEQQRQELAKQNLEKQLADAQKMYSDALLEKQELSISHAVQLHATRLGMDADVAERLIDRAEIEHDEKGNPTNVQSLLADLLKAKPYLKVANRQAPTSGGPTNPPRSTTSQDTADGYVERIKSSKLSNDEYSRLSPAMKVEIQKALMKR